MRGPNAKPKSSQNLVYTRLRRKPKSYRKCHETLMKTQPVVTAFRECTAVGYIYRGCSRRSPMTTQSSIATMCHSRPRLWTSYASTSHPQIPQSSIGTMWHSRPRLWTSDFSTSHSQIPQSSIATMWHSRPRLWTSDFSTSHSQIPHFSLFAPHTTRQFTPFRLFSTAHVLRNSLIQNDLQNMYPAKKPAKNSKKTPFFCKILHLSTKSCKIQHPRPPRPLSPRHK
jgi:hypothetical protein